MTDSVTSAVAVAPWRKSSYSMEGNCVELTELSDGRIGMRNSRHPRGPVVALTRGQIDGFLRGIKAGDFDDVG